MTQNIINSVILAQQGDVAAFSTLVNETQNLVTSTALAITFDVAASEDVAQTTYIDVWQKLNQLQTPESFLPRLRQITRNKAKNYLRDNKVARYQNTEQDTLNEAKDLQSADPSLVQNPESELGKRQLEDKVMALVAELPAESRDILILYYREQQNSVQVATLLDLSEANVRQKLTRLRASLKVQLLEQLGEQLLSSAPTIAFTALVTSSITTSAPVAAALASSTIGSSVSASASGNGITASGWMTKIAALLGGAFIGGFMAIVAIFFTTKIVCKRLSDEQQKQALQQHSRAQIWWVLISVICFSLSYEFTVGWIAPVLVYSVFLAGLTAQQFRLMKLFNVDGFNAKYKGYIAGYFGLILGALTGFVATIFGLINSGRLIL